MTTVTIAQIAIKGQVLSHTEPALLLDIFGTLWPTGIYAKFALMPGGFVHRPWPISINGRLGWKTSRKMIEALVKKAELHLEAVVTKDVYKAACKKADFLVVGVDLAQGRGKSEGKQKGIELVAVLDLTKKTIVRWTGKSYPTASQEQRLAHIVDLESHFLQLAQERVLVLGCHDLTIFNPRGKTARGFRAQRRNAMRRKVCNFKPTVILHAPHRTVRARTWLSSWSVLRAKPSVTSWASGIGYFGRDREPLKRVLDATSSGPPAVISIIANAARSPIPSLD